MATKSRRVTNINGAGIGQLKSVAAVDTSKGIAANAVKSTKSDQQAATRQMLDAIKQFIADSDQYQLALDAKQTDIVLGRIASLLDEFKESLTENELTDMKEEILDEISGISLSSALKSFLMAQVSSLFDQSATKDDIEELKTWLQQNIAAQPQGEEQPTPDFADAESVQPQNQQAEEEDVEKDGYKNSTPAENFANLQSFVQGQFDTLNENLKNIPGQSGIFSRFGKMLSFGVSRIVSKVASIGKLVAKGTAKVFGSIGSVSKLLGKGVFGAIGGIAAGVAALGKGLKGVVSGIGSIGSKIGKAVTSPFKAIGGFFSKINPFKRSDKKEDKKQKLRDKIMDKIGNVIDKMWKIIEPFIDKVALFMAAMFFSVILPIAVVAAQVLLIVAAIVAIGIGLYLAYKWVTAKIKQFWNYVMSGKLWEDIKAKLLAAWEWLKDFGGWLWRKFLDFGKWLFIGWVKMLKAVYVDFPIWIGKKLAEFGVWVWKKLCEFGKWLYDNYIDKYVIQPLAKLIQPLADIWVQKIQPVVQPFIDSLLNLKDKIVQAFSAWDTSKSIWENLKNIGGIIKDSVIEWWENSPFKKLWDDTVWPMVKPFIESLTDLKDRIVQAFSGWDTNKSIWDNLKNIGGILKDSIIEWWNDDKNPIKEVYNRFLAPIVEKVKDLIDKLGNIVWKLPVVGLMRPFGFLVGKPLRLSDKEEKEYTEITKKRDAAKDIDSDIKVLKERLAKGDTTVGRTDFRHGLADYKHGTKLEDVIKDMEAKRNRLNAEADAAANSASPKQIAAQQVQQAAAPIQAMENEQAQQQTAIAKTSQEVASGIEKKEASNQEYIDALMRKTDAVFSAINDFREDTDENFKKPNEHLIVAPTGPMDNDAMMASF